MPKSQKSSAFYAIFPQQSEALITSVNENSIKRGILWLSLHWFRHFPSERRRCYFICENGAELDYRAIDTAQIYDNEAAVVRRLQKVACHVMNSTSPLKSD